MTQEASLRLKQNAERIMKAWGERAAKEISAAGHQSPLALRNSLPEYLRQLEDALSTSIERTDARKIADRADSERVGKSHGHERAGSLNYSMDQLIFEYHILRQVICDILEEETPLMAVEREVIVASVEQAVNDAATQFSETLRLIQEKLTHRLAHDLRGPITAAKSSAQLILRRPQDLDRSIQSASRISASMDRLESMIHDLLDVSRIRAGQSLPLRFEPCDLDLIAREVAEENSFTHGGRFLVISSGPCVGYWSTDGLRRTIENLVTNAVKYGSPDTPITLAIKQTNETVTLTVHNEGAAIPPEEKAVLFQQFRRSRSAEAKQQGWGLGLTVVEAMAKAHHGSVRVESEEGRGTSFILVLPKDFRTKTLEAGQAG